MNELTKRLDTTQNIQTNLHGHDLISHKAGLRGFKSNVLTNKETLR